MRHLISGRKLNRTASHRKAMLGNLAVSILENERVTTTLPKAKEVRSVVERLITYAKRGTLSDRRLSAQVVKNKTILKKLFDDIAPSFKDREGGYTRIIRIGERRGDKAMMSFIELVGRTRPEAAKPVPTGSKKKTSSSAAKDAAKNEVASDGAASTGGESSK